MKEPFDLVATDGNVLQPFNAGGILIDQSFLHTTQGYIYMRDGLDLISSRNSQTVPKCIANWHTVDDGQLAVFQFNPNHERVTGLVDNVVQVGNCQSLSQFEKILSNWTSSEGFLFNDVHFRRCDYAIDCMNAQNESMFVKLASLVGFAFIAKHEPRKSDKQRYEIADDLEYTGFLVRKKGFPIQMNLYNKAIQNPASSIQWRFELRYVETTRNRNKRDAIKPMLEAIIAELDSLKGYYDLAQTRLSYNLAERYRNLQQDTGTPLSENQFLYTISDRVFSRAQIREFYRVLTGERDSSKLENRANNYADRYAHLFVSRAQFVGFIDEMIFCIQSYIKSFNNDVLLLSEVMSDDTAWMALL